MSIVAICSAKGAPGVSTLACLLGAVWPSDRRVLLVEADPSGGDLASRFSLRQRQGLTSLALVHRREPDSKARIEDHLQRLPGGLEVLLGPASQDSAHALDRELEALVPLLGSYDGDVVVDCGRVLSGTRAQSAIIECAELILLMTSRDVPGALHARALSKKLSKELTAFQERTFIVATGKKKADPTELAEAVGLPLIGVLPWDEVAASVASGVPSSPRRFARSPLLAEVRELARRAVEAMAASTARAERDAPHPTRLHEAQGHHGGVDMQEVALA
jgi:MinD-like ATPase involved in chromosome partitioning or flagellar assembly